MKNDLVIALLNPAIALVLASAFFLLWLHQRRHAHLAVLTFAYVASSIGFLLQYFTLPFGFEATRLLSNLFFTAAALGLSSAVIDRYGIPVPWLALGGLAGAGLAVFLWFLFVQPDLTARIYATNFAFGGISLIVAAELRGYPSKGPADKMLMALAFLSGLNFIVRTIIAVRLNGPFQSYEGFHNSLYWTTSMLSHALLSLLLALTLIAVAILDVLKHLKSETLTDPLSGLLNRRGFEEAASLALRRATACGMPSALVIADLDHFKSVNDTFGHDVGDKVIVAFAEHIRHAVGQDGVAGRIGGEEFAVFLKAADLGVAHLFAEGLRTSFSHGAIIGVPAAARVTASFGAASHCVVESLPTLMRRADEALYQAKADGRDRVRLSYLGGGTAFNATAKAI